MIVYCAKPISCESADDVFHYYDTIGDFIDHHVLSPMIGKEHLRTELKFKSFDYRHPVSTNHAIIERDRWMVEKADIIFVNLLGAEIVSIGCVAEMAWAHQLGKHTILCMEEDNIHQHAFVIEMADVLFDNIEDAFSYINSLRYVNDFDK